MKTRRKILLIFSSLIFLLVSCGSGTSTSFTKNIPPEREILRETRVLSLTQAEELETGFTWSDIFQIFGGKKPNSITEKAQETIGGACSGSVTVSSVGHDATPGSFFIELAFDNYNDCEKTLAGEILFYGRLGLESDEPEVVTIFFSFLSVTTENETYTLYDGITSDFTKEPRTGSIDIYLMFDGDNTEYYSNGYGMGFSSIHGLIFQFRGAEEEQ